MDPVTRPRRRFLRTLLGVALATLVLFLLVEGASSLLLVVHALLFRSEGTLAERAHTRYDPLLGWVSIPNLTVPDMYGPGIFLRTNGQGFRNESDFPDRVPPGRIRILCSGDSFTLGYGVDNDHAWCRLLSARDPRLETVNMGQGGYGLDQAYLWYMRAGRGLERQVHLLAFITDDFYRMGRPEFTGYGKPMLRISGERLETTHVPVPRRSYLLPWFTQNARILSRLKSLELIEKLLANGGGSAAPDHSGTETIRSIGTRIFEILREENQGKRSLLVLIYLPVWPDYWNDESGEWREFVRGEAARLGIPFIDLVEEIRKLPRARAHRLFEEHFTAEGNQFASDTIYERLAALRDSPLASASH
jgi:hypothetical protein